MQADIKMQMALAFFHFAWAAMVEEFNLRNLSGCNIEDVAPTTIDPAAIAEAARCYDNRLSALMLPIKDIGFLAAAQCLGHGVGLWEHDIEIELKYSDFSYGNFVSLYDTEGDVVKVPNLSHNISHIDWEPHPQIVGLAVATCVDCGETFTQFSEDTTPCTMTTKTKS